MSPAEVAQGAHDGWKTYMLPVLSDEYILRETYAVSLDSDTAPAATATTVPAVTGGNNTGGPLPGSVSLCLSLRTEGRGRSSRGRQYISGFRDIAIDGNRFTDAKADAVVAAFSDYATQSFGGQAVLVVVSRVQDKVQRAQALVQQVTAIIVTDTFVDSQRRRLTGRGQ
jgi:hypothetical protein